MYGMYPDWGPAKNRNVEATMSTSPSASDSGTQLVGAGAGAAWVTAVRDMADWRPDDN